MGRALRVLQVGELQLHVPLPGVAGLPPVLRDRCAQARERAALRSLEVALSEDVDLLLIVGGLADFAEEPRLAWWLNEQFRRLQDAGIDVVLASPQKLDFPAWAAFPANVRGLSRRHCVGFRLTRTGRNVELEWADGSHELSEAAGAVDLRITLSQQSLFPLVSYSTSASQDIVTQPALPVQRNSVQDAEAGAWLIEPGPACRSRKFDVEVVGWFRERIEVNRETTLDSLRGEMRSRMESLTQNMHCELAIVSWELGGTGPVWEPLANPECRERLMADLRPDIVGTAPVAWSWKVQPEPDADQWSLWSTQDGISLALEEFRRLDAAAGVSGPNSNGAVAAGMLKSISQRTRLRIVHELSHAGERSAIR